MSTVQGYEKGAWWGAAGSLVRVREAWKGEKPKKAKEPISHFFLSNFIIITTGIGNTLAGMLLLPQ